MQSKALTVAIIAALISSLLSPLSAEEEKVSLILLGVEGKIRFERLEKQLQPILTTAKKKRYLLKGIEKEELKKFLGKQVKVVGIPQKIQEGSIRLAIDVIKISSVDIPSQELTVPLKEKTFIKGTIETEATLTGSLFLIELDTEEKKLVFKTLEGENYLIEGEFGESLMKDFPGLEGKEITIEGLISPGLKSIIKVSQTEEGYQKRIFNYRIFKPRKIEKIGGEVKIEKPEFETAPLESYYYVPSHFIATPFFQETKGEVINANVSPRVVIPSIEVNIPEENKTLTFLINKQTKIIKVLGKDNIQTLPPTAIKVGTKVDVWFEQREGINYATMITVLE